MSNRIAWTRVLAADPGVGERGDISVSTPATVRVAAWRAAPASSGPPLNGDDLADIAFCEEFSVDGSDRRLLAILLVMYPEVFRVGVLVGASGTAANALAAGVGKSTTRTLLRFYPRESGALLMASVRIRRLFPKSMLRHVMESFHEQLGSAKQASLNAAPEQLRGLEMAQFASTAEAWRQAAARTRAFLAELRKLLRVDYIPVSQGEYDEIARLLAHVEAGHYPMLDGKGEVSLPSLFERRQSERARLWAPAALTTTAGEQAVIIRDMSATGLGIEGAHNLPVNTAVTVRIGPSLQLEGVIAWAETGRAGVRLLAPLTGANPFFAFCTRSTWPSR